MKAFLTAEWLNLAFINYEIEPSLLEQLIPAGTELDTFQGSTFISIVGFLFANTRVLGIPVPFHQTFEEVNLRFYVRRVEGDETRRGVTFIKELVPRYAIAAVARMGYNEPYYSLGMRHSFGRGDSACIPQQLSYEWNAGGWAGIHLDRIGEGRRAASGSLEEFITEHYWGYTRQRDGSTVEYKVIHPSWTVWAASASVVGDLAMVYGETFSRVLDKKPASVFVADGSRITVGFPRRITT